MFCGVISYEKDAEFLQTKSFSFLLNTMFEPSIYSGQSFVRFLSKLFAKVHRRFTYVIQYGINFQFFPKS